MHIELSDTKMKEIKLIVLSHKSKNCIKYSTYNIVYKFLIMYTLNSSDMLKMLNCLKSNCT